MEAEKVFLMAYFESDIEKVTVSSVFPAAKPRLYGNTHTAGVLRSH
jgi:hypothetical protein